MNIEGHLKLLNKTQVKVHLFLQNVFTRGNIFLNLIFIHIHSLVFY